MLIVRIFMLLAVMALQDAAHHHYKRKQDPSVFKGTSALMPNITVYGTIIMTDYLGELSSIVESHGERNGTVSPKAKLAVNRGKRVREETLKEVPFPVAEWPPLKVSQCPHDDREKHGSSERGLAWAHYQILLEFIYFDYDVLKEWEQPGGMKLDTVYESNSFSSISSSFVAVGPKSGKKQDGVVAQSSGGKADPNASKREAQIKSWSSGLYKNDIPFKDDDIMVILEDDALVAIKDVEGTLKEEFSDMKGVDLLYLGWCEGRTARPIPLCSHAYAVTRRGARKIVKHFEPCGLAYDWQFVIMIRNKWLTYRRAHSFSYENNYKPNFGNAFTRGIFQQMQNAGSFNGHRRRLMMKNKGVANNHRAGGDRTGETYPLLEKLQEPLTGEDEAILDRILALVGQKQLKKNAKSDHTRLLFIAGMEGSGHHMLETMFKRCVEKDNTLCKFDLKIHDLIFWASRIGSSAAGPQFNVDGLFGARSYDYHGHLLLELYKHMKSLSGSLGPTPRNRLVAINARAEFRSGTLSYPNFVGPLRDVQNPDFHILAAVAEAAELDFRVLVIQRSAADSWRSFHDRFYSPNSLMGMSNSAAEMFNQMHHVDPSFFFCIDYQALKGEKETLKTALARFLHPAVVENDGKIINAMLSGIRVPAGTDGDASKPRHVGKPTERYLDGSGRDKYFLPESTVKYHLSRYQGILDEMNELCNNSK
jgi:hypothetical protein